MQVFVVVGHPRVSSFNHALADTAVHTLHNNGHTVTYHDLYAEAFQPIIDGEEAQQAVSHDPLVEQHCAEIATADGIVVVHPNWWGQPPAEGLDRPGVAAWRRLRLGTERSWRWRTGRFAPRSKRTRVQHRQYTLRA